MLGLLHEGIRFGTRPNVEPPEPLEELPQVLDGGIPKNIGLAIVQVRETFSHMGREPLEEFPVGVERPGGCRALFRGEGLTDAQPRKREFHGGHRRAEPVGGVAFLLRDWLLGFTLSAALGGLLAGVGGSVGCSRDCHEANGFPFEDEGCRFPVQAFPYETWRRVRWAERRLRTPAKPMLNRSAVVIGREAAFYGWLKTSGITDEAIQERKEIAERAVYLIPACHYPEEIEEVVENLFEEIFRRELARWQPEEKVWPDTADFDLFTRWFTVEGYSVVEDVSRGKVEDEPAGGL